MLSCLMAIGQGGNWQTKSSLTTNNTLIGARFGAVSFSIDGKGYYGTGSLLSSNQKFKDFWSYDPITDRWTQIADLSGDARSSAFSFALSGFGYVGGGRTSNASSDQMFKYFPSSNNWQWFTNVPKDLTTATGRVGAFATSIEEAGLAYVGGGGDTEYNKAASANYYKDFWEFNPSDRFFWRRLTDMPKINKDAAMLGRQYVPWPGIIARELYVFCGDEKGESYTNKVWKFVISSNLTDVGNWQVPNYVYPGGNALHPVAFKMDNNNYYIGSGLLTINTNNYVSSSDFYRFSPINQNFCKLSSLPDGRYHPAAFAISNANGNKGYVVGGLAGDPTSSNITNNTNYEYSPLAITTSVVPLVSTCTSLSINFTNDCSYSGNITAELVSATGIAITPLSGTIGTATAGTSSITLNFNTVTPGRYRVRLKANTGASLVSSPSTFVITVSGVPSLPEATISLLANMCSGRIIPAIITSAPGISYTWSVTGGSSLLASVGSTATVTGISSADFNIIVKRVSTLCGITDFVTRTGSSWITPNTPFLTGPSFVCVNQIAKYTGVGSSSSQGGNYAIRKIGIGTLTQFSASEANFVSSIPGVLTLTCFFNNRCPSDPMTPRIITVVGTISPNLSIVGSNLLCANNTYTYSIPQNFNTTYTWSVTGAASILGVNQNTCTITGIGAGSFLLSVRQSNFCSTEVSTLAGVSNGLLANPTITGLTTICSNTFVTYSVVTQVGANYLWNVGANATFLGGNASNVVSLTGLSGIATSLMAKVFNSCSTVNSSFLIDYSENISINGAPSFCVKNYTIYTVASIVGASYIWSVSGNATFISNLNSMTITSSVVGLLNIACTVNTLCKPTAGIASKQISVYNSCCINSYFVNIGGWANPDPNRLPHEIGSPGTTTILSGGVTFNGSYHLIGNVQMSGNISFMPGSKLYADEGAIISFTGANVSINGTLLTSTCPSTAQMILSPYGPVFYNYWGGLFLVNNSAININNNTTISGSTTALLVNGNQNTSYQIKNTLFFNNISGIVDINRNNYSTNPTIQNSRFIGDNGFVYQALGLSNGTADALGTVKIQNNTITGITGPYAVYVYRGSVEMSNNHIKNVPIGIFCDYDMTHTDDNFSNKIIKNNNFLLKQTTTSFNDFPWAVYGQNVSVFLNYSKNTHIYENKISPDPSINITYFNTIGILASWTGNIYNNTISGINDGVWLQSNFQTTFIGNNLTGNSIGANLYNQYSHDDKFMRCNKIDGSGAVNPIGLKFTSVDVYPFSFGTATSPAGNKFLNNATDIQNNASSSLEYFVGANELSPNPSGLVALTNVAALAQCAFSGYPAGNGRMEATEPQKKALGLDELKDSLRYQVGNKSRQKYYQNEIIQAYKSANDLLGLENYATSVVNCNKEAYYDIYLYMMYDYLMKGNRSAADHCKQAALQPNPEEPYVKAPVLWFYYNMNPPSKLMLYGKMPTMTKADSSTLAYVAQSGTSYATDACRELSFFYRGYVCPTTPAYKLVNKRCLQTTRKEQTNGGVSYDSNALLQVSPNPATDVVNIVYKAPAESIDIKISLFNSSSFQKLEEWQVENNVGNISLSTKTYHSGLYLCILTANGKVLGTQKLAIIK